MDNDTDPASSGSTVYPRFNAGERRARVSLPQAADVSLSNPLPAALLPRDPYGPQPELDSCGVSVERLQYENEQSWYNELYLLAPLGYFLVCFGGAILQTNLVGAELLGIAREQAPSYHFRHFVHPRFHPDFDAFIEHSLNSTMPLRCMVDMRCRDQMVPVSLIAWPDGGGQALRVMVEPSEGRLPAIERSEERLRRIVHSAQEGIWEIDNAARTTFVNPKLVQMLGYTIEEMIGRSLFDFMDDAGRQEVQTWMARRRAGLAERHEFRFQHREGRSVWTSITTNPIFGADGDYLGALALVTDVGERRLLVERSWQESSFDALTGLPNRPMLMDRLAQETRKADRSAHFLALMLIDLDNFKEINEQHGPLLGDAILKEVARRIRACVRATDTLARMGGDEFALVLSSLDHVGSVDRVAQAILATLLQPFDVDGRKLFISASIGIALYPPDASEVDDLLAAAGRALLNAKGGGRGRFGYAEPHLQEAALARQTMADDLRQAISGHQFEVWYQPIVSLATGKVYKAEALLRWHHPTRGVLGPAEFIPFAESNGLIVEIGDWVFRQVARQVQQWQRSIDPAFQISVNKSPLQFRRDAESYQGWLTYLRQLGLPQNSIVVEITEGALMGAAPHVLERLQHYRDMGVQVSLDDFGTGYSSLSHLKRYAVDYVKIDQSFVANIEDDAGDLALCEAIIAMAHALGLKVIAEGVETRVQRALLVDAGCDYAQGFMFAHPRPALEFEAMAHAALRRLPH